MEWLLRDIAVGKRHLIGPTSRCSAVTRDLSCNSMNHKEKDGLKDGKGDEGWRGEGEISYNLQYPIIV